MKTFIPEEKIYSLNEILCDIDFIKKKGYFISNIPCSFDIETTSFYKGEEKASLMYAFAFGINGKVVLGRTWEEFLDIIQTITFHYGININKRLIVYVHNLSYEFQFMRKLFTWHKVFAIEERKPIYAVTTDGIEFRCSYLLSGYSLERLGQNLTKYKVEKMSGDLDYDLVRHEETPLTDKEKRYIIHDVLVVMCFIQEEIERLGSMKEIPLTQTGYVRNYCRRATLQGSEKFDYSALMKSLRLEVEDYQQLKRGYMGGFTHGNINYIDKIMQNVSSFDFTSSYPTVMVSEKFPMSKPKLRKIESIKEFNQYLNNMCCIFDITFYNIRAKVPYENYISSSRCFEMESYVLNNGRVREADKLSITITEQDYFIIKELYKWDKAEIYNFKTMYKRYLPKPFIEVILKLYQDKTTLKNVEGKEQEYLKAKEMLNSLYGMCCTDICRDTIEYDVDWKKEAINYAEAVDKANKDNSRFIYYAWGVWVTAYARRNLFSGIIEYNNDYLYSDTDSIKVINMEKHKKYIENYNDNITNKINACLDFYGIDNNLACPKTIEGKRKPLGVWDYEGTYDKFKTLGAKRYLTYTKDKGISITVAGVSKKNGKEYLIDTYKTVDKIFNAFREELHFPATYIIEENKKKIIKSGCGKKTHTYIDCEQSGYITDYLGNTKEYFSYSGVHLSDTDFTLNFENNFKKLLMGIKCGELC